MTKRSKVNSATCQKSPPKILETIPGKSSNFSPLIDRIRIFIWARKAEIINHLSNLFFLFSRNFRFYRILVQMIFILSSLFGLFPNLLQTDFLFYRIFIYLNIYPKQVFLISEKKILIIFLFRFIFIVINFIALFSNCFDWKMENKD